MLSAKDCIEKLNLSPHPEGGYFREIYRAEGTITGSSLPLGCQDSRNYSTAIYFLLTGKQYSHFHRIKSDEGWHFHLGNSLEIIEIDESGQLQTRILGSNILAGESLFHSVAARRWFAARLKDSGENSFALVSCTVAPGFDFQDFELASKSHFSDYELPEDYKELILS